MGIGGCYLLSFFCEVFVFVLGCDILVFGGVVVDILYVLFVWFFCECGIGFVGFLDE